MLGSRCSGIREVWAGEEKMSKPMQKHMVNSLTRVDPRWHVKIGFIFSNFFIGQASSVEFLETIIKLVSNQKGPSKVDVMPEGNLEAAWRQLGGRLTKKQKRFLTRKSGYLQYINYKI